MSLTVKINTLLGGFFRANPDKKSLCVLYNITFRLAATFGVTRQEQDDFARRSHQMALDAKEKGYLTDIIPVKVGLE